MKIANVAGTTADIPDLLRFVLQKFKNETLGVDRDEFDDCAVGMYIRPRTNEYRGLKKWLGQDWGFVGWIGYLLPKGSKQPELSAWLSFDEKLSSRRNESIQALRKVIRQGQVEPFQQFNDLVVKIDASQVSDD